MQRFAVLVSLVLLAAALAFWMLRRPTDPTTAARTGSGEAGAHTPAASPSLPSLASSGSDSGSGSAATRRVRGPKDAVNGFGAPGRLAKIPDQYEITRDSSGVVFVDLGGGKSTLYSGHVPAAVPHHALTVTVLDRARAPLANAVVTVEKRVDVMGGAIAGRAGATTDATGRATFEVPNEAFQAVAIHHDGWTNVAEVAADATSLELVLVGRGALNGRAKYNGHAETFELYLTNPTMRINYETDPDGTFTIASLPPGTWSVKCGLAQEITGGASKQDEKTVVIEDGKTATVEFDQTAGTTIVAEVAMPADTANPPIIQAFLFPGNATPPDATNVRDRARAEKVTHLLFGGVDAMRPIQFHDVVPGSYLVCELGGDNLKVAGTLFGCAQVKVLAGDPIREVKVALRAVQ